MSTTSSRLPAFRSIEKVAQALDVSTKTVRRWIERGELQIHRLGYRIRIAEPDLLAFLAQRRQ